MSETFLLWATVISCLVVAFASHCWILTMFAGPPRFGMRFLLVGITLVSLIAGLTTMIVHWR
jgi:hypothetical protein